MYRQCAVEIALGIDQVACAAHALTGIDQCNLRRGIDRIIGRLDEQFFAFLRLAGAAQKRAVRIHDVRIFSADAIRARIAAFRQCIFAQALVHDAGSQLHIGAARIFLQGTLDELPRFGQPSKFHVFNRQLHVGDRHLLG